MSLPGENPLKNALHRGITTIIIKTIVNGEYRRKPIDIDTEISGMSGVFFVWFYDIRPEIFEKETFCNVYEGKKLRCIANKNNDNSIA